MAQLFQRAGQQLRDRMSYWLVPSGRTHIMHSRQPGFDLLVRADEDVGRQIHFMRSFEEREAAFMRSIIAPDATCFDVGANVGYFSLLMASCATAGQVHAFDPLALNVALIGASAALNRFENIRVNRCAVGDRIGEVEFSEASDSAYSSMLDTGRKAVERSFRVPMTTIDAYRAEQGIGRIDVLKVDVEGAEAMVIEGARATLADSAVRPATILIELYEPNLASFGASAAGVTEVLAGLGYAPHSLGLDGLVPYVPSATDYNIVFRPQP
jgi:FkbM family methyltransferase